MIALIPARAGSKRVPQKNVRLLAGHPLITYTIAAAIASRIFERVWVCSDDSAIVQHIAGLFAETVWSYHRKPIGDDQPDIMWVREVLEWLPARPDIFALLRPTSPFRTAATIRRAKKAFDAMADCGDSIRAVERVKQTPFKMWLWDGQGSSIKPLLDRKNPEGVPYHSCPTQTCPEVWIQNSSLEMAWTANVEVHGTIHGRKVGPFFTEGYEGFVIDDEAQWEQAVVIAREHPELLPKIQSPDVLCR